MWTGAASCMGVFGSNWRVCVCVRAHCAGWWEWTAETFQHGSYQGCTQSQQVQPDLESCGSCDYRRLLSWHSVSRCYFTVFQTAIEFEPQTKPADQIQRFPHKVVYNQPLYNWLSNESSNNGFHGCEIIWLDEILITSGAELLNSIELFSYQPFHYNLLPQQAWFNISIPCQKYL